MCMYSLTRYGAYIDGQFINGAVLAPACPEPPGVGVPELTAALANEAKSLANEAKGQTRRTSP